VPAAATVADIENSLKSRLGTAEAASAALGIAVESEPTISGNDGGDGSGSDSSSVTAPLVFLVLAALVTMMGAICYFKRRKGRAKEAPPPPMYRRRVIGADLGAPRPGAYAPHKSPAWSA